MRLTNSFAGLKWSERNMVHVYDNGTYIEYILRIVRMHIHILNIATYNPDFVSCKNTKYLTIKNVTLGSTGLFTSLISTSKY